MHAFLLSKHLKVELLGYRVDEYLNILEIIQKIALVQTPTMCESSSCSTPSSVFNMVILLNFSYLSDD